MEAVQVDDLVAAVLAGDRRALAKAITLVESTREDHRSVAVELLELLAAHNSGQALRLGVSGVPGVGKSTFIEALGKHILGLGHRLAVLAVDPSSALSGGSIMGDKTRMPGLAQEPTAFVRPSPTGLTVGGVARRTREDILVCEAAGFDVIIAETVGVGQTETAVAAMTDVFLLLLLPGSGDELQGIKRGIVELADLVLVNKADGVLLESAGRTAADYRNALRFLRPRLADWSVPVDTCSALTGDGIAAAWQLIGDFHQQLRDNGELARRRELQARQSLDQEVSDGLSAALRRDPAVAPIWRELAAAVGRGETAPTVAAAKLIQQFLAGAKHDR